MENAPEERVPSPCGHDGQAAAAFQCPQHPADPQVFNTMNVPEQFNTLGDLGTAVA